MWKSFTCNNNLYMVKLQEINNVIVVELTNLISIWYEELTKESVLARFQECNATFEVKTDEAARQVIAMINNIAEVTSDIKEENEQSTVKLKIEKKISDFKASFYFDLSEKDDQCLLEEVTVPLIQTVKHLEEQQRMLCNLIQKKDRELEEYRMEKGDISRADLVTDKFDPSTLNLDGGVLQTFKNKQFCDLMAKKYGTIDLKTLKITVDPWNQGRKVMKVYSSKTFKKTGAGISYNKKK